MTAVKVKLLKPEKLTVLGGVNGSTEGLSYFDANTEHIGTLVTLLKAQIAQYVNSGNQSPADKEKKIQEVMGLNWTRDEVQRMRDADIIDIKE